MIGVVDTLYGLCGPRTKIVPGHGPVANRNDLRVYQAMLRKVRYRVDLAISRGISEEALMPLIPWMIWTGHGAQAW